LWQGFVESSPEKSDRVSPEELAHIRGYSNDHPFEIGHNNKGTKTIASAKVSHNTPYLKVFFFQIKSIYPKK
jgi:hypothetical protein